MPRWDALGFPSLVVLRAATALLLPILGADSATGVTITGKAVNPDLTAASGVTVIATPELSGLPVTAQTDLNGLYSLTVGPGCYTVSAESATYGGLTFPDTVFPDRAVTVNIDDGEGREDVDFHFKEGYVVSGTLAVSSGSFPSSLYVGLVDRGGSPSIYGKVVTTPDWSFENVRPGTYLAVAYQPGTNPSYSQRYYGDAYSLGEATPIMLSGDSSGIAITLEPVPVIKGKVTKGGSALANAGVFGFVRGDVFASGFAFSNGSGDYELRSSRFLPGVEARVYSFGQFSDPTKGAEDGTSDDFAGTPFKMTAGDNTGHDIDLPSAVSASGTLTEEGTGTPIAGASVFFDTAVPGAISLQSSIPSAFTNASGAFTYKVTNAGRYFPRMTFSSSSYYVGNPGTMIEVGASPVTGIALKAEKGGKFGGTITNSAGGAPVSSVQISYFDSDCKLAGASFTAGNGTYLSGALRLGSYRIRFDPPFFSNLAGAWHGGGSSCATAAEHALSSETVTTADAALSSTPSGTHVLSGSVYDVATKGSVGGSFLFMKNQTDGTEHFALTDPCGWFSAPNLTPGVYDALVDHVGYKPLRQPGSFTIASVNLMKDFGMTPASGAIQGHVTVGGLTAFGVLVCLLAGFCDQTDVDGKYQIGSLATGTFILAAAARDLLNARDDVESVFVQNGKRERDHDIALTVAGADPLEPDATGTPPALSGRLGRVFRDASDVDWFGWSVSAGVEYRLALGGAPFSISGAKKVVIDTATWRPVPEAAEALFSPGGWKPLSSGDLWLGLSSDFAGSYAIELEQGALAPTVSSITPDRGGAAGGTSVTIKGTGFAAGAQVRIGSFLATSVVAVDATTITAKVPTLLPGTLNDVVVTNPGMHAGSLPRAWMADFSDVPPSYLFYAAIGAIFRKGITSGCGGGRFCPDAPITRDAMSTFLLRATHGSAYLPPNATGTAFVDVLTTTLLARWIEQFAREGYTTGCGNGMFCPNGIVNRTAMAVFMVRALLGTAFQPPAATGLIFTDVTTLVFLAQWIELFSALGVTSGCGGGNYCPNNPVTRGEMARFVNGAFLTF